MNLPKYEKLEAKAWDDVELGTEILFTRKTIFDRGRELSYIATLRAVNETFWLFDDGESVARHNLTGVSVRVKV